jgi:putative toxin-antitoxin system antitoxin component (TIGR02293 family)
MNPNAIRAAAQALRVRLGMHDQLLPDFRDILKKLTEVFPETEIKVVSATNAPALAWTDSQTLYVQKGVFEGLAHDDVHARYIVAHEIAHIALQHRPVLHRYVKQGGRRSWQKQEMEAALFANEFLMPNFLVMQFRTPDEISARFKTSHHAALNRISKLVPADDLPLAPATRARTEVIDELISRGYTEGEISELVVPKRTLARRRAENELLTVEETDKALRLSRIVRQAAHVFGDRDKAHRWLRKPKRALNGETPIAFLASEEGARKVEEMLHRIDHGMAA